MKVYVVVSCESCNTIAVYSTLEMATERLGNWRCAQIVECTVDGGDESIVE